MDKPIGEYLLASELSDRHVWSWQHGDDWEDGGEAIRAVHFHTATVTEEELGSLLALPNLEAIGFCDEHEHTDESLGRIGQLIETQQIRDLSFEKVEHLRWLEQLPTPRILRLEAECEFGGAETWAPIAGLAELEALVWLAESEAQAAQVLSALPALERLVFTGELVDAAPLASVPRLRSLDLGGTSVADLSPLAGLSALEELHLRETEVVSLAPLAGLTSLRVLDLSQCKLPPSELRHLAGLKGLRVLKLSRCPIDEGAAEHLRGLKLEELDLGGARMSSALLRELAPRGWKDLIDEDTQIAAQRDPDDPEQWLWVTHDRIEDLADLRAASLADTYTFEPGGLDFLAYAPAIEHLDLTRFDVWPHEVTRIGEATSLRELSLQHVTIEDYEEDEADEDGEEELEDARCVNDRNLPSLIGSLTNLEVLDLAGAMVTAAGLKVLTGLPRLRELSLSGANTYSVGAMVPLLATLSLDVLDLSETDVDDADLAPLARLRLRELDLGSSNVTEAGLASIALERLTLLNLERTGVKAIAPLRGATSLQKLNLGRTPLGDEAGEVLSTLTGLERLSLSHTQVTDAIVPVLLALPALKRLELEATRVSDDSVAGLLASGLTHLGLRSVWLSEENRAALEAAPFEVELSSIDDDDDDERAPFAGLPQARFTGALPPDVAGKAWRLSVEPYEPEFPLDLFARRFVEDPRADQVTALVIGAWEEPYDTGPEAVLQLLVENAARLPALRSIFVGEMESFECDISAITHTDLSPLLAAFPSLEVLQVRGASELNFSAPLHHDHLRSLTIECGGLPGSVLTRVMAAQLPKLETLDLYLGGTLDDLTPLLSGKLFPRLRRLGLRNSEEQDGVAALVASAPVLEQLEALHLSHGTLTDAGAQALLASPAVARLKELDLRHHYMSEAVMAQVAALPPAVNVDDREEADDWGDGELHRYVAMGE